MNAEILPRPARPSWQERWASRLFWSWNIIFVAFMLLGFGPRLIPELVTAVRVEAIGWQFLAYALALALIPAAAMLLGWTALKGMPLRQFALGYVVEGPLMLMLAVRFFAVRQASSGLTALMIIAGLGMAAFLWRLLERKPRERNILLAGVQLAGLSLMVLVSLYAAVWISFYAPPGVWYLFRMLREVPPNLGGLLENLIWVPFLLLGFILLVFTASLLFLAPFAVTYLSLSAWLRACRAQLRRPRGAAAAAAGVLVAVAAAAAFVLANRQPQQQAFARLQSPPRSVAEARRLLDDSQTLRAGLLNAYLGPFRYISSVGDVNHISEMYRQVFNVSPQVARRIQNAYELVARPLLYAPIQSSAAAGGSPNQPLFPLQREPLQAARLYQRVFDETIIDGERQTILAAARSTWSDSQAEAALQTLEQRLVHLERQEIHVQENGDWAEIELYEVYRNTTGRPQEVIYYFSLPESAVITGIWLGESDDRAARHAYIVAPRGAAQEVYRNELRRNMDPALVEQIGPRQYRLRIFPVPGVEMLYDERSARSTVGEAPLLHFWMTWKTLSAEQHWPLPRLALKTNIFWDDATERLVNGAPFQAFAAEAWLPPALQALTPPALQAHEVKLPGGYLVSAEPAGPGDLSGFANDLALAVVVDRSHSMAPIAQEMDQALDTLRGLSAAQVDVYLTASAYRGEGPQRVSLAGLSAQALDFLGGQNPAQLLAQFAGMRAGRAYDAVIVLTDGSGYELGAGPYDIPAFEMPVWMVHLGDQIPIGYDDQTLAAVQGSQGGIVGSLDEALARIAVGTAEPHAADALLGRDLIDGYVWTVRLDPAPRQPAAADGFAALAARRIILAEMQRARAHLDDVPTLDRLHAIAVENHIVTPYSSMIVLVNRQQEQQLEMLSNQADRYAREGEDLGETTPETQAPLMGVPEPEEWLLIGVGALLLVYAALTRGRKRPAAASRNALG